MFHNQPQFHKSNMPSEMYRRNVCCELSKKKNIHHCENHENTDQWNMCSHIQTLFENIDFVKSFQISLIILKNLMKKKKN